MDDLSGDTNDDEDVVVVGVGVGVEVEDSPNAWFCFRSSKVPIWPTRLSRKIQRRSKVTKSESNSGQDSGGTWRLEGQQRGSGITDVVLSYKDPGPFAWCSRCNSGGGGGDDDDSGSSNSCSSNCSSTRWCGSWAGKMLAIEEFFLVGDFSGGLGLVPSNVVSSLELTANKFLNLYEDQGVVDQGYSYYTNRSD